jgi:hypothetical protein
MLKLFSVVLRVTVLALAAARPADSATPKDCVPASPPGAMGFEQ